ncbi:hypothetical protein CHRY9390_02544 [Chryseobacterium aquaeductus]|uniref:Uncharacterized protein n=1 Tax=Chryseobacterium aquaeductus TaxID=2675056 RepID=A0A9N8QVG0_9FLAO|nr:hypothetical protein [Chryseobacterium aquaeductus]CAA7331828.1 hypothetical protein CHRY9390_02544 [Chryseobacterium potabilaquae]CAD7812656.1 hypothetical protein CHRY9390_02544 [Chryseobacterium aquaeductus]
MRRIIKNPNSKIIKEDLKYKTKGDNSNLSIALLIEQKRFCAYTEEYIGINDAYDVEHFNPNFKNTPQDNYENWFCVKHKPNLRKSTKWFEEILHPTHDLFEERLIYNDGAFFSRDENDISTQNLIVLLDLNNEILVKDRQKYIARRKEAIEDIGKTPFEYFDKKIKNEIWVIRYLRAIQTEFDIDIWSMIPNVQEE